LFYLYVDECGDDGDFNELKSRPDGKGGSSQYFTIGGIVVNDKSRILFSKEYDCIIQEFFSSIDLPNNFKLHYEELRFKRYPYNLLGHRRFELANRIFCSINLIDCYLLSVTIDIDKHCKKYYYPVNVRAYGLFLLLERFQYLLEDATLQGEVIYEKYNNVLRKKVDLIHRRFMDSPSFPTSTDFRCIKGIVKEGNPLLEHVLQFADFFTYAPWIKCQSNCTKTRRYEEIKHKYYNFNLGYERKRGNYEI
jgi:Protein of unknown function (DUF3800)